MGQASPRIKSLDRLIQNVFEGTEKHSFSDFLDFTKVNDTLVSMKVVVIFRPHFVEGGTPRRIDIGRLVAL
jgi:hypothetical protein